MRSRQAVSDGRGTGQAYCAGEVLAAGCQTPFQRRHRVFDPLGIRLQLLCELGEPVAPDAALDKPAPEAPFKLNEATVHSGLVHAERLRRRQRAAVAGEREEVFEVVPVEHALSMQLCGAIRQSCGCPSVAPERMLISLLASG